MPTVCALVVTRNRKHLLDECVTALLSQSQPLSELIILDNASSDGSADWLQDAGLLQSPTVRLVRNSTNSGGAGGYADGLRACLEGDSDWIWLMDDDAEPSLDALELLLGSPCARDDATAALCTSVQHPDGTVDPLHRCRLRHFITPLPSAAYAPGAPALVDCASFVGLLIRTPIVRALAPPRREFFLGYDDAEYSLRVREHGDIRLVAGSVITHKIAIGGGRQTRRSILCNRLLGQHYTSSSWETYWKDLYRVRNFIALRRARGHLGRLELAGLILGYVAKALLYDQRPLRRIPWIVRYALRGWRGDFNGHSPEQWADFTRKKSRRGPQDPPRLAGSA